MAKGKRVPEEVKIETARRIKSGEELETVAAELKVHPTTVQDWVVKFGRKAHVVKAATNHKKPRPNALKVENENLKREVEFWKNSYLEEYRKNVLV